MSGRRRGLGRGLIPETQEDLEEIDRVAIRGEVDTDASFGDRRAEVAMAAARLLACSAASWPGWRPRSSAPGAP